MTEVEMAESKNDHLQPTAEVYFPIDWEDKLGEKYQKKENNSICPFPFQ